MARKRISLSMRTNPFDSVKPKEEKKKFPERKQPQQKRGADGGKPRKPDTHKAASPREETAPSSGPFSEFGKKWKEGNR